MTSKRNVREIALKILFAWDSTGEIDEAMGRQLAEEGSDDPDVRGLSLTYARGAWEQHQAMDVQIERLAPQWPPRRQPAVDRNLIRLATWELSNTDVPPRVVLDEAIELAKIYSTQDSPSFVNGVLDAVLREIRALKGEKPL